MEVSNNVKRQLWTLSLDGPLADWQYSTEIALYTFDFWESIAIPIELQVSFTGYIFNTNSLNKKRIIVFVAPGTILSDPR